MGGGGLRPSRESSGCEICESGLDADAAGAHAPRSIYIVLHCRGAPFHLSVGYKQLGVGGMDDEGALPPPLPSPLSRARAWRPAAALCLSVAQEGDRQEEVGPGGAAADNWRVC